MSEEGKEQERSCDGCTNIAFCKYSNAMERKPLYTDRTDCPHRNPKEQPAKDEGYEEKFMEQKMKIYKDIYGDNIEMDTIFLAMVAELEQLALAEGERRGFERGKEQGYYDGETIGYKTGFEKGKEAEREAIGGIEKMKTEIEICPYCEDTCNDLGGGNSSKSWNGCTLQGHKPCKDKYTGIEDGIGFRDCVTYQERQEDDCVDYGVDKEKKRVMVMVDTMINLSNANGYYASPKSALEELKKKILGK